MLRLLIVALVLTVAPAVHGTEPSGTYPLTDERVQVNGHWLSIEQACAAFAESEQVRAYLTLREQCGLNAEDHFRLARWCESRGLADSAKAHFRVALELDPNHQGARSGLGLRQFRGMLLLPDEIEALRSAERARQASLKQWRASLTSLDRRLGSRSASVRQQARDELMRITDPSVLPALEDILCRSGSETASAGIDLMATFDSVSAIDAMVRQVCASPHIEVRQRVAEHLKAQSPYRWVPQLLSTLQAPISLSGRVSVGVDNVNFGLSLYREGPFADELVSYMAIYSRSRNAEAMINISYLSRRESRQSVAELQQAVDQLNQRAEMTNQRVTDTLRLATSQTLPAEQESWYRWWYDKNEYYYPTDRPLISRTERSTSEYSMICSCFLAGTLVTTWTGLRPIESIEVGDCVLAIEIETGELAFKPVYGTTRRPPSRLLAITADDQTIHVTRGHPLWVVGRGWQMAKEISAGDAIYSTTGELTVSDVTEWADSDAYNLIVADFKNYFVTARRVLVHDNTMRHPTDKRLLPGVKSVAHATD